MVVLAVGAPEEAVGAVRSLLVQSPRPEIVVVNSGGGNMEAALARNGIDVKVVEREERLLVGAARNLGIAATRATYVAFLASDCRASAGWVRHRLKAHRQGHLAVGSAVVNDRPRNPFAWAHHFILWPRRTPTIRQGGLPFGASYHRWLFDTYGLFRGDLTTAEDTEFNLRLAKRHRPVWRRQVRTIHLNPGSLSELVADHFRRGQLAARTACQLRRPPFPRNMAAWAWRHATSAMGAATRYAPARHRAYVYLALPIIPIASAARCAGIIHWHRRNRLRLGRPYPPPSEPANDGG